MKKKTLQNIFKGFLKKNIESRSFLLSGKKKTDMYIYIKIGFKYSKI